MEKTASEAECRPGPQPHLPARAARDGERWAVVLAGGDGTRLRPLTRLVAGDERPKQFCALLGGETLLAQTRARAALAVEPRRTVVVVTRSHARFYAPLLALTPPGTLLAQPGNRGTAPAILYALRRIAAVSPLAHVALMPSDHYVSDAAAFMRHVDAAFTAVALRPDLVVLLGIQPQSAETDYGWIEAAEPVTGPVRRVRRFWEKPDPALARTLLASGCLWNSFVIVAAVPALLALIRHAVPALTAAFGGLGLAGGGPWEARAAERLYRRLAPVSFSDAVLARGAPNLAVLPVTGVEWSDWGQPARVLSTLAGLGVTPAWEEGARAQPAAV